MSAEQRMRVLLVLLATLCVGHAHPKTSAQGDQHLVQFGQGESGDDKEFAESAFLGSGGNVGKYFQYVHVPSKDHFETGHKRGNEHHFIEKHEKVNPHAGEYKAKVKWGDKHGGYGEHYWDLNHAGHDDGYDDGEGTNQEPEYVPYYDDSSRAASGHSKREKRSTSLRPDDDVEFISAHAEKQARQARGPLHGGNYQWEPQNDEDDDFRAD